MSSSSSLQLFYLTFISLSLQYISICFSGELAFKMNICLPLYHLSLLLPLHLSISLCFSRELSIKMTISLLLNFFSLFISLSLYLSLSLYPSLFLLFPLSNPLGPSVFTSLSPSFPVSTDIFLPAPFFCSVASWSQSLQNNLNAVDDKLLKAVSCLLL